MSSYTAQAHKATETYLTTVAKAQDDLVKAVEAFVKQIPKTPAVPGVPASVDLPTLSEVTAASLEFSEKMLAQNRSHTEQLIAVLTPAKV